MEAYGRASFVLNLSTCWRRMVVFTPRSFYPHGKGSGHLLNRRLGRSEAGLDALEKRKIFAPAGNRTLNPNRLASSLPKYFACIKTSVIIVCG